MKIGNNFLINFLILLAGIILFFPYLGSVHLFDWDEANFAESAREMIVSGNYFNVQINFEVFWEKPPLFIWLQVLSMKLFGVNEFAARFPNAVAGLITLLVLFNIGKKEFDQKFGLLWVLAYLGSLLPHFYFKTGIMDPVFNLFIFLCIYKFICLTNHSLIERRERVINIFWAGIFMGLALLTKGPAALVILGLCILAYYIISRSIFVIKFKEYLIFFLMVGIISFAWFGIGLIKDGPYFLIRFIEYQITLFSTAESGHGGPIYYHFVVLLIGCFPASIFMFKAFIRQYSDNLQQRNMKVWMMISFFVVLILFTIVKTKIVHYSSFCYYPITFLAAYSLYKIAQHRTYYSRYFYWWFLIIGGLISLALIIVPLFMYHRLEWIELLPKYFKNISLDEYTFGMLHANVHWTGFEVSIGCFYFLTMLLATYYHYKYPVGTAVFLFISTILTLQFTMYLIVPKIEEHVQGAAIQFYKSVKNKDAYVESVGFKSYADMFYAQEKPGHKENEEEAYLLVGTIDKPAYLIRKAGSHNETDSIPGLYRLGEKNGFIFYKRER